MFVAQARMLDNFTATQWEVVESPRDIWVELRERYHKSLARAPRPEASTSELSGVAGPIRPDFLEQEALNYRVLDALKPLHEAWSGVELEPTSVYGVRVYRNGSTLKDHLDVPETHVISSILHIDSDLDAPFPLEIQDATGTYSAVDLRPGQMCFYESAKAFHRRSIPMRGRHYGSLFLHYRPKDWTFSRNAIRLAVPPHWNDEAPDYVEGASEVTFLLAPGWPRDAEVTLSWVPGDGSPDVEYAALDARHDATSVHSFIGHTWRASAGGLSRTWSIAAARETVLVEPFSTLGSEL